MSRRGYPGPAPWRRTWAAGHEQLLHDGADTVVHALAVLLDGLVLQVVEEDVEGALLLSLHLEQLEQVDRLQVDEDG